MIAVTSFLASRGWSLSQGETPYDVTAVASNSVRSTDVRAHQSHGTTICDWFITRFAGQGSGAPPGFARRRAQSVLPPRSLFRLGSPPPPHPQCGGRYPQAVGSAPSVGAGPRGLRYRHRVACGCPPTPRKGRWTG